MDREEAVKHLESKLAEHIDDFFSKAQDDLPDSYEAMGWVGHALSKLMARAAMAAWEASAEIQEFIKTEGVKV